MEQAGVQLIAQGSAAYLSDMKKAENATRDFVDTTEKGGHRVSAAGQMMIGGLRHVGTMAVDALAQAARATAAFVGDSIGLAGDFDQKMSVLQATSGATTAEMEQLSAKAKALGSDLTLPATSAVDAGEALLELAKSGFTVTEQMDAAKGVLQLAAAAQISEAKAAEINANALQAFGLEAKESMFVSDLLAASANASSLNATDMADTYKMAGAVFSAFQGPVVGSKEALIDLTTAAGLLGNAGIKGSDAGTALKQSLLQLSGPSMKAKDEMRALFLATQAEGDAGQNLSLVLQGNAAARAEGLRGLQESAGATAELGDIAYDAAGNMRPFPEILRLTAEATKNMTAEQRDGAITTIFGADAARAILVLMQQGPEAWDKMTDAVTRQGAAEELAAAQTKGFNGALEGAKSQVETLQLTIGQALTPILADLLNKYVSPGIAAITAFAESILAADDPMQALIKSIDDLVPGFASFVDAAETGIGIVIAISTEIDRLIGTFAAAEAETHTLGGAVDDLSGVWAKAQLVIGNVMDAYMHIAEAVLPIVAKFVDEHGDEIQAFFQTTFKSIIEIVTLALDTYNAIVPPILNAIAGFIEEHSSEIQRILSGAWTLISSLITGTLDTIKGVFKTTLALINGDWEGAWNGIKGIADTQVKAIEGVITGFLNIIAGIFDTDMASILKLWTDNWDMLVDIATETDWLKVGKDAIDGILQGFEDNWNSVIEWIKDAMGDAVETALCAIGACSPAKEFMPVGEFAVLGIMEGFRNTWPALTDLVGSISADLIDEMMDIGRDMQGIIADSFGATASMDRQIAKNLDSFKDVLPQYASFTTGALKEAQSQAEGFLDPAEGAKFFAMRSKQILEYAKLQKELSEAETADDRARIEAQMLLINRAQTAEISQFNANQTAQQSAQQQIVDSISAVMAALTEIDLTDEQIKIVDMLSGVWAGLQAPVQSRADAYANPPMMSSQYAGGGSNTTSNTRTYNMPIYTNNTPVALQQSLAIANASMP